VLTPEGREIRNFGAMTHKLPSLADWLSEWGTSARRLVLGYRVTLEAA
jgi:hypothetical protein